jgi:hypothetical protein
VKISIKQEVKLTRIADLLCSALEGGSSYWCDINWQRSTAPPKIAPEIKKEFGESKHISWPLSDNGHLCVVDLTDDEEYFLDLPLIVVGLQAMADKYPKHFADLLNEDEDADTADTFLQCCLFGEERYG